MNPQRILVLDGSTRQALAACRGLGSLGHHVAAAGHPPTALAGWSKYTERYHQIPDPRGPVAPYGEAVQALVRDHGYEVVVAVEDPAVAQLAFLSPPLATSPLVGAPLDRLADKLSLAEVAAEANVEYPRTAAWDEWVASEPRAPELPVFVKPRRSAVVRDGAVHTHSGASPAHDLPAAEQIAADLVETGLSPIVQERVVRSDKINATIFRRDGRTEVRFPYRVVRDTPLTGGLAVSLETVSAASGAGADAVAALEQVCDAAGYEGVANGEFCVAETDGRLVLIEVNTRLWGSLWFAERLGQRVAERSIALALGLPAERAADPPQPGRRFHNPAGEARWILLHSRRLGAAADVLRSLRPWDVYEYLDHRDLPATMRYVVARPRDALRPGA